MKEEFVSNGLARKLQAKGCPLDKVYRSDGVRPLFYEFPLGHPEWQDCDAWYVPTVSQVLVWLREVKNLHIEIVAASFGYSYIISKTPFFGGADVKFSKFEGPNDGGAWDEWEGCVIAGIEYVIDNLI